MLVMSLNAVLCGKGHTAGRAASSQPFRSHLIPAALVCALVLTTVACLLEVRVANDGVALSHARRRVCHRASRQSTAPAAGAIRCYYDRYAMVGRFARIVCHLRSFAMLTPRFHLGIDTEDPRFAHQPTMPTASSIFARFRRSEFSLTTLVIPSNGGSTLAERKAVTWAYR